MLTEQSDRYHFIRNAKVLKQQFNLHLKYHKQLLMFSTPFYFTSLFEKTLKVWTVKRE